MNGKRFRKYLVRQIMAVIAVAMLATPSFALEVEMFAGSVNVTMPDGTEIPMWGFGSSAEAITVPGPMLEVEPGDTTLTIHLTNNLDVPVSLVIPGQIAALSPTFFSDAQDRTRVRSLTAETAAGATGTYTWTGLKPGTYIYHSGTHPALQVHMGLYGGVKIDAAAGEAYPGVAYQHEVILFYSEIDPDLHWVPTAAQPTTFKPSYFLINGKPFEDDDDLAAGMVGQNVLVRFLNAGLKSYVPTFLNTYIQAVAEDGNLYPFARQQYSVLLPAMKTLDVLWQPDQQGTYPVFDAAGHLTTAGDIGGMVARLSVGDGSGLGAPVAVDDSATVAEGGTVTVLDGGASSVLENDTGAGLLTAVLVDSASVGMLTLNADGTFSYTHNGSETTSDYFTYRARDANGLESPPATVTITVTPVNDAPIAVNDAYQAVAGETLVVPAPGVLGNDSDPEGDPITAVLDSGPAGGLLSLDPDGSFSYTPYEGTQSDSFIYRATDGSLVSAPAMVTITVGTPVNQPPVAGDDYAQTTRNNAVFVNLAANDSDPDGNLKDASGNVAAGQFTIVTPPTRGGTVQVLTNGVNFTPKKNFLGTDVFTYTVKDLDGAVSNEATVRVNVVRN
jgi:VCBS repeat-containing protein